MSSVDWNCFIVTVSSLRCTAWWPHDLLQRRLKMWTQPLKTALPKGTFFIAATSVAPWLHCTRTTFCAFRATLKSFPYIWGCWMRNIHTYKCLFYQTNAYQTGIIVCSAHNKEGWFVHFILWALSSTAEIKKYFHSSYPWVSLQTTPSGSKNLLRNTSVKVRLYGEPHHWAFQVITWAWQWGKLLKIVFCVNCQGQMSHYYII